MSIKNALMLAYHIGFTDAGGPMDSQDYDAEDAAYRALRDTGATPAAEAPAPTVGDGGMRAVMDSLPENDQVAAVAFSFKAVPAPTAESRNPWRLHWLTTDFRGMPDVAIQRTSPFAELCRLTLFSVDPDNPKSCEAARRSAAALQTLVDALNKAEGVHLSLPAPTADAPLPDAEVERWLEPDERLVFQARASKPNADEILRRLAASRKAHAATAATAARLAEAENIIETLSSTSFMQGVDKRWNHEVLIRVRAFLAKPESEGG